MKLHIQHYDENSAWGEGLPMLSYWPANWLSLFGWNFQRRLSIQQFLLPCNTNTTTELMKNIKHNIYNFHSTFTDLFTLLQCL